MGGWKRMSPLFDKQGFIGSYGNGLIDVKENPKILKRFWPRRSRVIRNSCKNVHTGEDAFRRNFTSEFNPSFSQLGCFAF